jgi:methylenetetrahydrofolate reductase (NADPH)
MTEGRVELSFEIFPPRNAQAAEALAVALVEIGALGGTFLSITSGAGGGTPGASADQALEYQRLAATPARPHLTCVQGTRAVIRAQVEAYRAAGIHRFVALRGDSPAPDGRYRAVDGGFAYADTLVRALKDWGAEDVAVGAYPEAHPESGGAAACLDFLKRKIDAGADRILTQYCFETDTILAWHDRVRAAGIDVPIGVGIIPIGNFPQIRRFSERCGAGVPSWLVARLGEVEPGSADAVEAAVAIAVEQCRRLVAAGLTHLHLYTLNRSSLTATVVRRLVEAKTAVRGAA